MTKMMEKTIVIGVYYNNNSPLEEDYSLTNDDQVHGESSYGKIKRKTHAIHEAQ